MYHFERAFTNSPKLLMLAIKMAGFDGSNQRVSSCSQAEILYVTNERMGKTVCFMFMLMLMFLFHLQPLVSPQYLTTCNFAG